MYQQVSAIKNLPINGKLKSFTLSHKSVYFYLLSWQEQAGKVFPSQQRIADDLGASKRSINRYLESLENFGLITRRRRFDTSTEYRIRPAHEVIAMNPQGQDRQQENAYQEAVQEPVEGDFNPW
ncbi:Sugar-specific transcriptional regulator TrmB [Serratia sp. FGI94]|nr:Sugar-specific transcriptional regulator TrmB [Serratia sp. FGI94]